jgi:putative oxidoreductase
MTTRTSTTSAAPDRTALALALLRVVIGIIFVAHGWQKLFIFTLSGTTGSFTEMGMPLPSLTATAIAFLELLGGAALIAGIGTRIVAALLALDMLGAIVLVHLNAGFFNPNGVEFPLALLAATVALALAGAGEYALDALLRKRA